MRTWRVFVLSSVVLCERGAVVVRWRYDDRSKLPKPFFLGKVKSVKEKIPVSRPTDEYLEKLHLDSLERLGQIREQVEKWGSLLQDKK